MAKKTKIIPLRASMKISALIDLLEKEVQDAKLSFANQWGDSIPRNLKFTWEEPPMFVVEPDMKNARYWQITNRKSCEIEASSIKLKQMAEYICADLNNRLDK